MKKFKRVLSVPFIIIGTIVVLPIITIFFLLMMLVEVISRTIEWVTDEE